ncbi:MAG TPA: GAF domain-containing sensor histidine kinase [Candidatus Angelobacter sp.]|nr:GAF domain-containing sensor histidine kinase [Candidatus Angelobacter sp.]
MTALELISFINQVLFIGLFVVVLRHALRQRSRASANTALLFGSIATVVVLGDIGDIVGFADHPAYPGVVIALLAVAPLAMLRLVDDFSESPAGVQVGGFAGFVAISVLAIAIFGPMERVVSIAAIIFFLGVGGYAAIAFAREARRTRGITARRMAAVAVGATLFIAALVAVFAGVVVPRFAEAFGIAAQVLALVAALAFFLGFAPPAWVRHAWREPDLRRFLERSIHLAGVADERQAIAELNAAAADAFGATGASIGLADPERGTLRYVTASGEPVEYPDDAFVAGRAFRAGQRMVIHDATADDPDNADQYLRSGARAVIATPIATESQRLGVLSVFAERTSIFVEDDLWLIDLLADQSAVLLEARALAVHATTLRAREEAARLKEEFLSAAAHDLRTPLTVVLGQAELLERRRLRNPDAPVDPQGLVRIVREARRLSDLVTELLDAQRLEQGAAVMDLAPADLLDVVDTVRERYAEGGVSVTVDQPAIALVASIDRPRIEQVLDNLVENALKYSPRGDAPQLSVRTVDGEARIAIVDHGIGIPEADRGRIFERFFRASNAQSITDTGLGLGLYICRRIIEEHHGRIWFAETAGGGTTFTIALPLLSVPATDPAPGPGWEPTVTREAAADA